ncbi:unnamed protein product [Diabrotica balteata]|uniref:Ketosynthase family 3 (KS3) domain-containing protein n=1 Tax=Diabrotica balteata TaxID=107213 RepID=A0A9N9TGK0_DIABA|nr:unnamed protein product [Diabrotica balteata]
MNIVPDDVVISGIGGLFPKSTNIGEFKQRLFENEILLEQRFEEGSFNNASGLVGCINSEQFDHSFFGIHRQQSLYADPMHRLALERALEALADAGIRPSEFRGRRIGCFMGSTVGEDDHLFMESVVSGFGITGHSRAMLANRISYFLNLRGPSVAYDCNWISGMEVLRLAYCAIKSGQCEAVIVGTTNLASLREFHELYEELGFLSKDGSTKAFDADASGYARSEGVVLLVVQKSSECRKHYASIEHIATRFDGRTADRFMSIDENNMVEFLEDFYEKCRIKPNDIEYLETYGCGLKEIDKRELNGLARVYCKDRPKPLLVGSVKTITGHAEATSSLFSIVNALVALDSDCIPATLQYSKPNPDIKALVDGKVKVLTENKKWKPTYVAVNALGISSYFGHAVFKANPKEKVLKKIAFPVLLNASTRTEEGIDKIIETLKKKQKDPEFYSLVHQFFAKAIQGHLYRGYLLLDGEETKFETVNYMGNKRQVWFVYSGMGSQWNQMLGDLMQIPIFAKSIQKSCEILAKKGVDLMNILSSSEKTIFDNILHCFVGIASMQIALTDVLKALGKITIIENEEEIGLEKTEIKLDQDNLKLQSEDIYSEFEHRGYEYSNIYKTIKDLTLTEEGSVSTVEWKDHWLFLLEAIVQQHIFNAGERSQDMHVPKFIQKITIANNDLPQDQKDVSINYDYSSRLIYTPGMEVSDMETVPFECKSEGVKITKIDMVQLDNSVLNNMKVGIELAFHLCLSNHGQQSDKKMYVSEYVVNNSLSEHIKPVIRDFHKCNINYLAVKEIRQLNTIDTFAKLIIINDVVSKEIIKVIKNCDTAFLLAKVDRTQQLDPAIARVAYFRVGQDHYMICKKVTDVKPKIINIKEPTISLSDLQKKSIVWVAELLKFSKESSKQQIPILLTTSVVPSEGFIDFIEGIRSLPNMEHVRIFYNLDKNPDRVNEAIKRDISLVILNKNQWWTYMPLNVDNQNEKLIDRQSDAPILENKSISYLGVNLKDETLTPNNNDKNEIGNIDYAGLAKNGERVMGLAYLDKENSKLIVDDDFTWKIPAGWTFESAATVPHAYTSAYYMLIIKARVKHGDTVLIHSGCSPVGFAAMNIAFSYGCQVFVTVNSERQKAFIKKHFTYMQARNILNYTNTKFETDLMTITGGKGAEVILNCLSGPLLRSSLNCIANYGRFIQYGKYDMEEGGSIGMYCFLRNVSFYCVDLNKIFFKEKDIKAELNKLIEEGLANYTVRPLKREVIKKDEVADVMSILQNRETIGKIVVETGNTMNINKINIKDPNRFICNSKDSYLIWGGSANHWSHIAEWLVHRGARKVVIASESKPKENHLNRRLQFLQTYYGADLIMAPSRVQTKEHAQNLVSDVQNFGKLHAVFALSQSMAVSSTESESVELLEKALERIAPKAILINFVKSAAGLCHIRAPDYPTYNINVNTEEGVKDAIVFLDKVLCYKISNLSLRRDTQLEETQGSVKSVIKDVTQLLPSEQEVIRLQKNASDEPEFVQVLTEGPLEIRELAPLFVIPGLTGFAELEQMLKHILYPTFCAVLPSKSWSLEKLAKVCAQRMSEIYSGNDYNIVSISTGGALAIEIAKILSKQNKNLHLFFVDSAPLRIQQGLEDIGEGQQLEINLLRIIFDISDPEIIKKLTNSSNLESRVQMLLKDRTDLNDKNKKLLEQGLPAIKDYIEKVKAYKPDNEPINAKLHILLPEDCSAYESFGLSAYFTSLPEFAQFDGDHLSIIASYDVSEYINKTALSRLNLNDKAIKTLIELSHEFFL